MIKYLVCRAALVPNVPDDQWEPVVAFIDRAKAESCIDVLMAAEIYGLQYKIIEIPGLSNVTERVDMTEIKPNTDYLLQFFEFGHIPDHLKVIGEQFHMVAHYIVASLPSNPERTVALRKLLEAKDCAVRAALFKQP